MYQIIYLMWVCAEQIPASPQGSSKEDVLYAAELSPARASLWQGADGQSLCGGTREDKFWNPLVFQYKTIKSSTHPLLAAAASPRAYIHTDTGISSPEPLASFTCFKFPAFVSPWGTGDRSPCTSDTPWPESNPPGQPLSRKCYRSGEKQRWHHWALTFLPSHFGTEKMLLASSVLQCFPRGLDAGVSHSTAKTI